MASAPISGIQPDSVKEYKIEEKSFTLSPNTYDMRIFEIIRY